MRIIIRHRNSRQIRKQGQENNQVNRNRLINNDHARDQVYLQVQAQRNPILDIRLHALEDLPRDLNRRDDGAQPRSEKDNIRRSLRRLSRALNSNATVGFLKRRRVIHAIARHGRQMAALLEHLDDLVFVLGKDLGEAVRLLDQVVLRGAAQAAVDQLVGVVHLGAEREHLARFFRDGDCIAREHFYAEPEDLGFGDCRGGVFARGVEHWEHAQELPWLVVFFDGYAEGAEAAAGELGCFGFVLVGCLLGAIAES